MNKILEQGQSAYIIPIQKVRSTTRNEKPNKSNQSLPSITMKEDKVNLIRRQIQQGSNQITYMKARINALRKEKIKNQEKKKKNVQQIQFIKTVRNRMYQDRQFKESYRKKRLSELDYLHQKATTMRERMKKERSLAKSIVNQQKSECAQQERLRQKQDAIYMHKVRELQQQQNRIRAQQIKRVEQEIGTKMKILEQSRLQFAKNNHETRVMSSLKQKKKIQKTLYSLKKEQESLVMSVKQAQQQMRETLYELETLNPEKKGSRFRSSRTIELK